MIKDNEVYKKYGDIINLPYPQERKKVFMSTENRAAQFSPFAALTGFDTVIDNAAREYEQKMYQSENNIDINDIE